MLLVLLAVVAVTGRSPAPGRAPAGGSVETVGRLLFTDYLFPFELTSVLLLAAMVGVLAAGAAAGLTIVVLPSPTMSRSSAVLFAIGVVGVIVRRNPLVIFMSIELMLNAANLVVRRLRPAPRHPDGQVLVFFVMAVAAAEVAVGLAIIVAIFRLRRRLSVDDLSAPAVAERHRSQPRQEVDTRWPRAKTRDPTPGAGAIAETGPPAADARWC